MRPRPGGEWRFRLRDVAATVALGRSFGEMAPEGAVLLLEGPLGAGKTTLAQGVGAGCAVAEPVTSPSYNLILRYEGARPFTHVDLFRIEDEAALATLGLDEVLGRDGVTCVEWPALVMDRVDPPFALLALSPVVGTPGVREVVVLVEGAGWDDLRERLAADWDME